MGEFVTVSAFETVATFEVVEAVCGFFAVHGWRADRVEDAEPVAEDDIAVFAPADGWTVVTWPGHFTELAAAE